MVDTRTGVTNDVQAGNFNPADTIGVALQGVRKNISYATQPARLQTTMYQMISGQERYQAPRKGLGGDRRRGENGELRAAWRGKDLVRRTW